jgi:S-adenosylmethionine:tRNA ribosyltransferase-isomerase
MDVVDFDFELPPVRIAQHPPATRDAARLLVLERASGAVAHRRFPDVATLLRAGDLLVLNDTRVVAARLLGHKATGGRVELLLLEPGPVDEAASWRCLVRGAPAPSREASIDLGSGLSARILARDGATAQVRFTAEQGSVQQALERHGQVPLPPYIRRDERGPTAEDRERYQTVYAKHPGAVAAPTAGLHFTPELLDRLVQAGVELAYVTLHVGLGTFEPVRTERVGEHRMHSERFTLPPATAEAIRATRARGGRVVAVGTTVVRVLETCAAGDGLVEPRTGRSELFIFPGYRFGVVDALLTNFHLPRSTLLMLVCAFGGQAAVLSAYREAVRLEYRFYSYGDAMWIGPA